MKLNKNMFLVAALLVLTITLAACGDSSPTTGPAAAPTTAAMTTAAMMTTGAAMTTPAATTAAMTSMAAMTTPAATTAAMTSMPAMTTAAMMTTGAAMTAGTTAAASGKTMQISISNYKFAPDTITIPVGTKVIWTNTDSVGHTVTSDDATGPLKSSLIDPNKTFEYTFDKAGTYSYHCQPHPFMMAKIIVQ